MTSLRHNLLTDFSFFYHIASYLITNLMRLKFLDHQYMVIFLQIYTLVEIDFCRNFAGRNAQKISMNKIIQRYISTSIFFYQKNSTYIYISTKIYFAEIQSYQKNSGKFIWTRLKYKSPSLSTNFKIVMMFIDKRKKTFTQG